MAEAVIEVACPRCGTPSTDGARFCASCGAPLAERMREERRVVTVLFGDLSGFTELSERRDAEEIKAIVDRAFAALGEIVAGFGGRVDKVIGDEIMAVFGAPQAHEDDAERAVRAALAIRQRLNEESVELERERGIALRMHIGLNTGEVVAGFVGDSYTVLGDSVNTARRIEDAAEPGQILVGEATYLAAREAVEFRRLGPMTAKGKRLPVTVYEVVGEAGRPAVARRASPLVGRDEELGLLQSIAGIVRRDRRPVVATIVGEAGMGKSRLAAEFARRVATEGTRVLDGHSLAYGTVSPATAVEEIVRAALLLEQGAEGDVARAHVRERLEAYGLASESERSMALLGLAAAPLRGSAGAPGAAPAAANPLLDAAAKVIAGIARAEDGLVLAFHEVHWAEDAVLDWIGALAKEPGTPVLILCLARPSLLERRPGWPGVLGAVTLPLEPLTRDRAGTMLDLLSPELPPRLREAVLDRAGGNPFYLEELAQLVRERPEGAESALAVPMGVQALVTARLDALAPTEKRVLQDAAVVGEHFWPGALERLGAAEPARAIAALVARELVEPTEGVALPGESAFRFRQTLVREVAYGSVPKNVRAQQHEAVGGWLEEVTAAGGKQAEFYDLIAYHFERAALLAEEVGGVAPGAVEKAARYLERAGDRARGLDASSTAGEFFARALRFAADDLVRLQVRVRLADALVGTFRHDAAEEHLDQALAEARRLGDRATEAKALRLLGDSLRMRGFPERAREPLERALALAKEAGDEQEEAEGLRSHGLLDMVQGRWSSSTLWFRQALARSRALEDRRGEGWALQNLGWASMLMGRTDDALGYLEEGEKVFETLGDQEGAGWCLGMRAWVLMLRGEVMEAGAIAERLEHQLTVEHPEYLANMGFALEIQRILLAYVDVLRGRLGTAQARAVAAMEGDWRRLSWVRALAAFPNFMVATLEHRFDDARALADDGHEAAAANSDPFYKGLFVFARSLAALNLGRLDDTERALAEISGAGELGMLWAGSGGARYVQASLLRARGRVQDAASLLEERLGRLNIALFSTAQTRALLAELALEAGDVPKAIAAAREAVEESGEEVLARAVANRTLAAALLADDDAGGAEEALRAALEALDGSDWSYERGRVEAMLARALDAQRRHDEAAEIYDRVRSLIASLPPSVDTADLQAALHG